jgi:hypothetical protein
MTRDEYRKLKTVLEEVHKGLAYPALPEETRRQARQLAYAVAGRLHSIWVPIDWPRRTIMIGFALLGASGVVLTDNPYWLLAWVPLPMMSPRLGGTAAYALGRFKARMDGRG